MAIRFFEWKDRFKRKKRSTKPNGHGTTMYPAPRSYYYWYNRTDRNKSRILTRLLKKGKITEDDMERDIPRRHRHRASWDYW